MENSSKPSILSANNQYRTLIFLLVAVVLACGWLAMQLTESYIQELQQLANTSPEQALNQATLLLVLLAMAAGFPTVGIGAYFMYHGTQVRQLQRFPLPGARVVVDTPIIEGPRAILRGNIILVCGGLLIVCGLVLPLIAWWLAERL